MMALDSDNAIAHDGATHDDILEFVIRRKVVRSIRASKLFHRWREPGVLHADPRDTYPSAGSTKSLIRPE